MSNTITEHHIWCSFYNTVKPENCRLCIKLYEKYPYSNNEEAKQLHTKHFPEAIPVTCPDLKH